MALLPVSRLVTARQMRQKNGVRQRDLDNQTNIITGHRNSHKQKDGSLLQNINFYLRVDINSVVAQRAWCRYRQETLAEWSIDTCAVITRDGNLLQPSWFNFFLFPLYVLSKSYQISRPQKSWQ